jgi:hypothetical protein
MYTTTCASKYEAIIGRKIIPLISLRCYASARLYYLHTKLDNVQIPYYP